MNNCDLKELAELLGITLTELNTKTQGEVSSLILNKIEELSDIVNSLEKSQNEVIALGGDDLGIREEIWRIEDDIDNLRRISCSI